MPSEVKVSHEVLTTPNPKEVAIKVCIDAKQFIPAYLPDVGTAWKDLPKKIPSEFVSRNYGDYVFTTAKREGENVWLYFAKNKTDAEKNTPFEDYWSCRDYPWPAVLEDLWITKASTFPQAVNTGVATATADRLFPRFRYRPGVSHNSPIRIQQYLAPTPWSRSSFKHDQPVPTDVDGVYLGMSVSFPRCLHPRVRFPETLPGAQIVYGVGVVNPPKGRTGTEMVFPETNFLDWQEFVVSDEQQQTETGQWLREKVTIFPPPVPEEILR